MGNRPHKDHGVQLTQQFQPIRVLEDFFPPHRVKHRHWLLRLTRRGHTALSAAFLSAYLLHVSISGGSPWLGTTKPTISFRKRVAFRLLVAQLSFRDVPTQVTTGHGSGSTAEATLPCAGRTHSRSDSPQAVVHTTIAEEGDVVCKQRLGRDDLGAHVPVAPT